MNVLKTNKKVLLMFYESSKVNFLILSVNNQQVCFIWFNENEL